MKSFIFVAGLLLVCAGTIYGAFEETEIKNIVSETGKEITLQIVHKESEEDIDVFDDDGTPLIKVEIIEKDGYQIDKPVNESACLLSQLEEYENKSYCYDRMEYPPTNISQTILDHCEGRLIYVLVPRACNADDIEKAITPSKEEEGQIRMRRSWRCYWTGYDTLKYVKVTRCCRRFFAFCTRRCFVRYEWRWVRINTYRCSYYW